MSGLSNAFPREGETLFRLARAGRYAEAMSLYRWFMPLLHLDARPDLVQCIKLCEHIVGRGTHLTRPPRLALDGGRARGDRGDDEDGARDAAEAARRRAEGGSVNAARG